MKKFEIVFGQLAYCLAAKHFLTTSGYLTHKKDKSHMTQVRALALRCSEINEGIHNHDVERYLHQIMPIAPNSLEHNLLTNESEMMHCVAYSDFILRVTEKGIIYLNNEPLRVMMDLNIERGTLSHFNNYISHFSWKEVAAKAPS